MFNFDVCYLVILFSEPEILDPCDIDSELDDSEDCWDEVEEVPDELEEFLECLEWLSSMVLASPHSLRCLIWVICLSSLAILTFWSFITFLTSESFLSDSTFKTGAIVSENETHNCF